MNSNPLIVALDVSGVEKALNLVRLLAPVVPAFKVGKELFVRSGPDVVRQIRAGGSEVFLDLKFHDIPNTVARAVEAAVEMDVQLLTVHASGGAAMLQAAEQAAQETARRLNQTPPLVLGVTVLTSLESHDLAEVGIDTNIARQVERLAMLCVRCGLRGLVCSPLEIAALRQILPEEIQLVTPGIRASASGGDDQKRTLSAREAMDAGASRLVVGRPIHAAQDPLAAAKALIESLGSA